MFALAHMCRVAALGAVASLTTVSCMASGSTQTRLSQRPWSSNEISRSEIQAVLSRTETAADIVATLRPGMLTPRHGGNSYSASAGPLPTDRPIRVYVDYVNRGGLEVLSTIPAGVVVEVRRLNALDATTRFGSNHLNGAILVITSADARRQR
jgi:hypothetical protein